VASIAVANSGGSVNGGGQLLEPMGAKRSQWHKISFGGWVQKNGSDMTGEWEVNFHNVGDDTYDKSKFYATKFVAVNFFTGNSGTCHSAFNFTANGKWNNKPGYKIIFRGGDFGSPGRNDTARVTLYAPGGGKIYDTEESWGGEFNNESSCVGTARTGLDKGNLTIVLP
jgi:hypothetical protein